MDWQAMRRTTGFRIAAGFVIFLVVSRLQGVQWVVAVPISVLAALAFTVLFNYLESRRS